MMESSEGGEHKLKPTPYQTEAKGDPSAFLRAELLCISWTKLTLHGRVDRQNIVFCTMTKPLKEKEPAVHYSYKSNSMKTISSVLRFHIVANDQAHFF